MKKLAIVLLSIMIILGSIAGTVIVPIGGTQPVGAEDPTPTPQWVYQSTYSGQPVSYWKYTVIGQETLPVNPGGSDGGLCDKIEVRVYSDAACTVTMVPTRVATVNIKILSPGYDWRHVTDRQLRQRYSAASASMVGNVTNWLYYRLYTTSSFGAPYAPSESWTFTEQIVSSQSEGNKTTNNITAAIASATESVTVPAGTFTCYKLTITEGSKTIIEYWDAESRFPYAPVKVVDSVSFGSTDTRVLYSSSSTPTPTPTPTPTSTSTATPTPTPTPTPSDYWDIPYKIVGFQTTIRYSLDGRTPVDILVDKSGVEYGNLTIRFSKNVINGQRQVIIPASSFHLDSYSVNAEGYIVPFTTSLTGDATGTLYTQYNIGDVDVFSESSASTTPQQTNIIGDRTNDSAGSLLIHMPLRRSCLYYTEPLYDSIFTTGYSYNHVTRTGKGIDNAVMAGNGVPCAEYGGLVPYVATPLTIVTTGTGNNLNKNVWMHNADTQAKTVFQLVPDTAPHCVITLEQCQSGLYINPSLPLCWETNAVGIGESFSINVSSSLGSSGIEQVRFSSDDNASDGVPTGQWTQWYEWDTSSGPWYSVGKTMAWSCTTGGVKEIWVELNASGQTSQYSSRVAVFPLPAWYELPDQITLDEVGMSSLGESVIGWMSQKGVEVDTVPVFIKADSTFTNEPINIVLVVSPNPPTKYNLVRIRTNSIQDSRDMELYAVMKSSGIGQCIWNTQYEQEFINLLIHPVELAQRKIVDKLVELICDGVLPGSGKLVKSAIMAADIVECVNEGYSTQLEGYENSKDYLVYLPVGYDFIIKVQRGTLCYQQACISCFLTCPPPVKGERTVTVSDSLHDISLDVQQTRASFFGIRSPGELRVYDAQGQVTGLVEGEVRQEIPNSTYYQENKAVAVFSPASSLSCEVVGTGDGYYGLSAASFENGNVSTFNATGIPITTKEVHQYTFDWGALSQGEKGISVKIDCNGDGIFEQTITSDATLQPPVAEAGGPYIGSEGYPVTLNASGSYDPDGNIALYEWDINNDGVYELSSTSPAVTYTWPDDYTGNVSLRVTDDDGLSSIDTVEVIVSNVPPTVEAGSNQNAVCCVTNVSFNGSFTDPGTLDTHTIAWNFGDGSNASGTLTPIHKYCSPGNYTVILTVTDDDGGVGTDTMIVHVVIAVTVKITPQTLNIKSNGGDNSFTAQMGLPAGYDVSKINVSTVRIDVFGTLIAAQTSPTAGGMVKFDRQLIIAAINGRTGMVIITVTGRLNNGTEFTGSDTINVSNPGKK